MLTTRLGWFGAVAYALPILEVWLLTRLSERGATALLVALQAAWVVALIFVVDRCLRGSKAYRVAAAERAADEAAQAEREALAVANAHGGARGRSRRPGGEGPHVAARRPAARRTTGRRTILSKQRRGSHHR